MWLLNLIQLLNTGAYSLALMVTWYPHEHTFFIIVFIFILHIYIYIHIHYCMSIHSMRWTFALDSSMLLPFITRISHSNKQKSLLMVQWNMLTAIVLSEEITVIQEFRIDGFIIISSVYQRRKMKVIIQDSCIVFSIVWW